MSNPESSNEIEIHALKAKMNHSIETFLHEGVPTEEIAQIFDAKEFLTKGIKSGKPYTHFRVRDFIENLSSERTSLSLPEHITRIEQTILPPDEGELQQLKTGESSFKQLEYIPRSRFLIELFSELKIPYTIITGKNDPNIVRELSYQIFILSDRKKIIFSNNEKGNATFILHDIEKPEENWELYANKTKKDLKKYSNLKVCIISFRGNELEWKKQISDIILNGPKDTEQAVKNELYEHAPDGWMTCYRLSQEIGTGNHTIKKVAYKYAANNPDLIKRYFNERNQPLDFFAPELIEKIKNDLLKFSSSPEGWLTQRAAAEQLGVDRETIKNIAEQYRINSPEYFEKYRHRIRNRELEFYSPKLVEILKKDIEKLKETPIAPEGWETASSLAKKIGSTVNFVQKIIENYRSNHPEWFNNYRLSERMSNVYEYLSPDLVEIILNKKSSQKYAPEGWMTLGELKTKFGGMRVQVNKIADKYRDTNPEYFRLYIHPHKRLFEYYSPQLVEIIQKIISSREYPPSGWITNRQLAAELGVKQDILKKIAKKYIDKEPAYSKQYYSSNNVIREHYSPELVATLQKKIKKY